MDINSFLNQIFNPIFIIKPSILIVLFFYIIFAFIVFKQIKSLNQIVKAGSASSTLELIAIINLFIAIAFFLTTLVIL